MSLTAATAALVGAGITAGSSLIGTISENIHKRRQAKRDADKQHRNSLDLLKKQHEYEVENYKRQLADERANQLDLLKNKYKYEVSSLRGAGLSPALAAGGGLANSSPIDVSSNTSASATAPNVPFYGVDYDMSSGIRDAIGLKEMMDNNKSTRDLQDSQKDLNESQAEKTNLDNLFFRDSYDMRLDTINLSNEQVKAQTGLTKEDLWLKQQVNGYYAEHPEYIEAISKKEKLIADNLSTQKDVMLKNISLLESQKKNVDQNTRVQAEQEIKTAIETAYTEIQREYLMSKEWRENYKSPSWLLHEQKRILTDDSMSIDEKIEKGVLIRKAYDECSDYVSQSREFGQQLELQDNELDFKYIELTQRGADSLINDFLTYSNERRRQQYKEVADRRKSRQKARNNRRYYDSRKSADIFYGRKIRR